MGQACVCWTCCRYWKVKDSAPAVARTRCSECHQEGNFVGKKFQAPKRGDVKGWRESQKFFEDGGRQPFHAICTWITPAHGIRGPSTASLAKAVATGDSETVFSLWRRGYTEKHNPLLESKASKRNFCWPGSKCVAKC